MWIGDTMGGIRSSAEGTLKLPAPVGVLNPSSFLSGEAATLARGEGGTLRGEGGGRDGEGGAGRDGEGGGRDTLGGSEISSSSSLSSNSGKIELGSAGTPGNMKRDCMYFRPNMNITFTFLSVLLLRAIPTLWGNVCLYFAVSEVRYWQRLI